MNEKLIGYAISERDISSLDGRPTLQLKSTTSIKVAMLGKERTTLLESRTLIQADTQAPLSYQLTATTNDIVQHLKCEFHDGFVRSWSYRGGDEPGEATEVKLDGDVAILGSNNFAHWQLILQHAAKHADGGTAQVSVYLPDAAMVERFELIGGAAESEPVEVAGVPHQVIRWRLEQANLNILADAESGEIIRMDLPGQQTTIELTDANVVKLAQKSRAEEVLDRHFAQSNVTFDDFLKVRVLEAELDVTVIGSGTENDKSTLTTQMQKFSGSQEADHVAGRVTIGSVPYHGEASPPFPLKVDDAALADWLAPATYIESDHAAIIDLSQQLIQGATTRWEVVQRIGHWVHQQISYSIAETPSARLALEKKQGDCGPHSTLMVALLRAAGVPSRLVGGLVYTPTFGGSFGQHAWVEVHMGHTGWIALDPTTGEFDQLSATHIKLFEGLGGVLPKTIKVTAFEPPNRDDAVVTSAVRPLAWKLGKKYNFRFYQGEREIGSETVTIAMDTRDDQAVLKMTSDIGLTLQPSASLKSQTVLVTTPGALPLTFARQLSVAKQDVKIECTFKDGVVQETISGTTNISREIKLPAASYCFDNNLMGCWVLICSQLSLVPEKPLTIKTYHPSSLQIMSITFTPKSLAPIEVGGNEIMCFECHVAPINNTFWISQDGRFVRAQQGDLVMEVAEVD